MSDRRDDFGDREDTEFSFRPAIQTLWAYRRVMALALAITVIALFAGALVTYVLSPRETVASIKFRLTFEGAEDDEYPNGTRFSSAEIVAAPVLDEVYRRNELKTYATFQSFKESIFILHSNPDMEL